MADPQPNDDKSDKGETVSKAEFETLKANYDKAAKDLEDVRMEVLTPEYEKFLDSLEKDKVKKPDDKPVVGDDEFKNMSPKQIYEKAVADAEKKINDKLEAEKQDRLKSADENTKKEIAAFGRKYPDFETYRPVMYGLSLDPKLKDLSLQELYDRAKEHVKKLSGEPSPEEKEKNRKSGGLKPGGDSGSLDRYKKMSTSDVGKETMNELGPIPQA